MDKSRVLDAVQACVARFGIAKTTIDDVAREAGVSRATIYRTFPDGREQLLREAVGREMTRFFARLAAEVADAPDLEHRVEDALVLAHRAVGEHAVLRKVLETEPELLLPLMTVEQHRVVRYVREYLRPLLEAEAEAGRLRPGIDVAEAADYLARMWLSLVGTPGRWDLAARPDVRQVVRGELLAGVLADETNRALSSHE